MKKWVIGLGALLTLGLLDYSLGHREVVESQAVNKYLIPSSYFQTKDAVTYTPEQHIVQFGVGDVRVSSYKYDRTILGRKYQCVCNVGYFSGIISVLDFMEIESR